MMEGMELIAQEEVTDFSIILKGKWCCSPFIRVPDGFKLLHTVNLQFLGIIK